MTKIEQLKQELSQGIVIQIIFAGITATALYCLAMAWINHNFIAFMIAGIFTACGGWLTFMQSLSVLHTWQKVGREQIRQDLEEAKRRFDIKF
jgi:cobalamin biosynthesis protein CobD/CbiB